MGRFSLDRDDDVDENSTTRKRLRMTADANVATASGQHPENDNVVVEGEHGDNVESGDAEEEREEDEAVATVVASSVPRNAPETGVVGVGDVVKSTGAGPVQMILTDPDVFDCPICLEALTIPIFQCENGHIACTSCCAKMSNKCPSCSMPIGYNRCRAIEKVVESVKISCRYVGYGCEESLLYSKKNRHESSCVYAPCSCPLDYCDFVGTKKSLYAHVNGKHSGRAFMFNTDMVINLEKIQMCLILQEETKGTIFVLNHRHLRPGSLVNVNHIGPASSKRYSYEIIHGDGGDSELKLKSYALCFPKWSANNPFKRYLLIPSDFIRSSSLIRVSLRICE